MKHTEFYDLADKLSLAPVQLAALCMCRSAAMYEGKFEGATAYKGYLDSAFRHFEADLPALAAMGFIEYKQGEQSFVITEKGADVEADCGAFVMIGPPDLEEIIENAKANKTFRAHFGGSEVTVRLYRFKARVDREERDGKVSLSGAVTSPAAVVQAKQRVAEALGVAVDQFKLLSLRPETAGTG